MTIEEKNCAGCGKVSTKSPMIGVKRFIEGEFPKNCLIATKENRNGKFAAYSVCMKCWKDPANRKVNLKMHFFGRREIE